MATAGTKTHASAGTGTVATAGLGLGQAQARAGAGAGLMTAGGKSRKEYPPLCNDSGSCEESAMEKMPAPSRPSYKLNDDGHGGEKKGQPVRSSNVYGGRRGTSPPTSAANARGRVTRNSQFPSAGMTAGSGRQKVSPSAATMGIEKLPNESR